jgi:hypothetical protein
LLDAVADAPTSFASKSMVVGFFARGGVLRVLFDLDLEAISIIPAFGDALTD